MFAGVAVFVTLLALFQHANVRLRFPGVRWVINTPEWHHWHHAIDPEARDKNFGIPIVDKVFGTAYLPTRPRARPGSAAPTRCRRTPTSRHLAYPFTRSGRGAGAEPVVVRRLRPNGPIAAGMRHTRAADGAPRAAANGGVCS